MNIAAGLAHYYGPPIDPLGLYAAGIDTSDYVAAVAPIIRQSAGSIGDLLDVGAGGGQLGGALREPGHTWTALEPAPVMIARLQQPGGADRLVPKGWREAGDIGCFDTVMAANMPAPLTDAREFLARCKGWSRRRIIWLVPAQNGPRGLCLAGCLPAEWHGEDETPGVDLVLGALGPELQPQRRVETDWTFSLLTDDLSTLSAYLADRLHWSPRDARRPALFDHLNNLAVATPDGLRLDVARRSAILTWEVGQ